MRYLFSWAYIYKYSLSKHILECAVSETVNHHLHWLKNITKFFSGVKSYVLKNLSRNMYLCS